MVEAQLAVAVGAAHVVTDPDLRVSYETDWTGRWRGQCRAVVRPGSTAEVAAVLRVCAEAGVPVVPQGGNTGLVGGSVPVGVPGAVVLSTRRLAALGPVDAGGTLVVGAGSTLASVQRHARAAGWTFGLDFAARDSATVGGAVATNAGGLRVLRWGSARVQVVGVEAVLASGAVLSRVGGPVKDSTGYDLSGLLCGSEGTLGVLSRVRLRLVPPLPAERAVALVGVDSITAAGTVLAAVRRRLPGLAAAELIGASALGLAVRHGVPAPLPAGWAAYVLLETAGPGAADDLAAALAAAPGVGDAALAADAADRARLWRCREELTPAISAVGVPLKLDVSLPPEALAAVWEALPEVVPAGAEVIVFGHLAEANLHVNVLSVPEPAEPAVTEKILRLVADAGGSISAEHGIGRAKARWLGLTRSPAEVAAMRAVKSALDPAGLLNPGVLLADEDPARVRGGGS